MNVIFLDIDGVLNDFDDKVDSDAICERHLEQLKSIVDATDAKVVLSSTWRTLTSYLDDVFDALRKHDIPFIGVTPEGADIRFVVKRFPQITPRFTHERYFNFDDMSETVVDDRGAEIAHWLCKHEKDVDRFVILDDEDADIMQYFPHNLVKTSCDCGLSDEDVEKAINILKGNKS